MNTHTSSRIITAALRRSARLSQHNSSLRLLIFPILHSASPHPHPGDMSPSRERVSSEEASTCQKKSTSRPSCLPSPSNPTVSHISHAPFLGTHHSSFPLLPSSSCHLIQITELASVSFRLRPHFAWQMDRRREDGLTSTGVLYMCVFMRWKKKREERGWNFSFFSWGGKMSNREWSGETFICQTCVWSRLSGYWATRLQLKESLDAKIKATEWVYFIIHLACQTV